MKSAWDWIRIRAKILGLSFRIWQHTRRVRSFKARVEAHMVKYSGVLDKEDQFLLMRLRQIEAQEVLLKNAARTTILGWKVIGDE
jgi:hypothetical protein